MSNGWPLAPIEEVLQLQRRWIKLEPDGLYTEIGVRSFGKGIFHKTPVTGLSLGDKRVLRVCPGDLVFNNVFAWEGAVAVASDDEDGTIGSHRFVTYTIKDGRADARFLQLFFRTEAGLEALRRVSPGSAGRNKTLNLDQFAKQLVPVPPHAAQQRIVAKVDELTAKIEEARHLCTALPLEVKALLLAARNRLIGEHPADGWAPLYTLIEDIENGWSPQCESRPATVGEWGVLKVGAVSFGYFDSRENKALPAMLVAKPGYEIKSGDFLMTRANTRELVGACALVHDSPPRLLLCDKIFRFIFKPNTPVLPSFLDHVLKSPVLREQIERGATGTSPTMKNISKAKILSLQIPVMETGRQRRVVAYLDDLQAKVDSLKVLQAQSRAAIVALLPSILDKAFKGQL